MALEQQLTDLLKKAMMEKDLRTADAVRMLKTKIMERRTAKGFSGTVDDALVSDVISAYRKSLQKALAEFEALGERGREQAEELRFEIGFCGQFLPKGLDEDALKGLIQERIGALGLKSRKEAGRLLGDIMKSHKGLVEAADVKRLAEALLPE